MSPKCKILVINIFIILGGNIHEKLKEKHFHINVVGYGCFSALICCEISFVNKSRVNMGKILFFQKKSSKLYVITLKIQNFFGENFASKF